MITYLGWGAKYPWVRTLGEVYYYGTIIGVIVVFLILVGKRLLALGYPKKRVILFTVLSILMSFPAGYLGSRAATMFYKPFSQWSIAFFFENMFHGASHTYHASLIGPLVFGAIFCYFLRLHFLEVFDTIYLYVPMAHFFGRSACFLIGCCWGNRIAFNLYGLDIAFQNPVPIYDMAVNLCIFLFLRRLYATIYADPWPRQRYQGSVFAFYFVIYAAGRMVFEVFRTEHLISLELTQAQLAMIAYLLFAFSLFVVIWWRYQAAPSASADSPGPIALQSTGEIRKLFSLAILVVSYVLLTFLIFYLTRKIRVWPWPFSRVESLADAYLRVGAYLPMMLLPWFALTWMKRNGLPIWSQYRWTQFSPYFLVGLAMSIYYSLELLVFKRPMALRGLIFWPPAIMLSLMNAFAEEIMYRQALYGLLRRADYSKWIAIPAQAAIYSIIHFMIAGAILGIFSLIYGIVLGLVADRNRSITPAIICHFIIDIGCIGMPMLRM
ncbi:MAG: prolipoprotein diacylglyceryl transferase [Desulfobacteraceae bacterium]|nr:prolipoprotein diacylglyceryl transferase [Desulfobacteraceae bacterium]